MKNKGYIRAYIYIVIVLFFTFNCSNHKNVKALEIMAGSATKLPLDEIVKIFEKTEHIKCIVHYGSSGEVLSQILLSERGDIYIPGSDDFMEKAVKKGLIEKGSIKIVAYLIPSIAVHKGNPKNITNLNDLSKPGIRVAIGNPQAVCIGLYAIEILKKNNMLKDVQKNIVTEAESCEKTANLVSLGLVDSAIGWRDFENWDKKNIEIVPLKKTEINRIAVVPIGITKYNKNRAFAQRFVSLITGDKGKEILKKYGYIIDEKEAKLYALPDTPIGALVQE